MPNIRTGQNVSCPSCGKTYYRAKKDFHYRRRQTCGQKECVRWLRTGERNPFWQKKHSEASLAKIRHSRATRPQINRGPKGYRHTAEAKRRISDASKRLWAEHREKMLANLPRGEKNPFYKPPHLRRYRKNWSRGQLKDWTGTQCAYCDTAEDLVLDHIVPIFDGGTNIKANAQTLCRGCNLWKTKHVDLPRYRSVQATKGA